MDTRAVVLNYFGARDTIECVHSLLLQDLNSIYVLDNSDSDTEFHALQEAFKDCPTVVLLSLGENLGFSKGVNHVVHAAGGVSGKAFLILNNDTIIPQGSVTRLRQTLISGNYAFVAPVIHFYPEVSRLWSRGSCYNKFLGLISSRPVKGLPGNCFYLTGCCLLIRGEVFEKIGFFDESFFFYGEDIEYCFRASVRGLNFEAVPDVTVFHKASRSSVMNSPFYEYHMNRAHLLLCDRLAYTKFELRLSFLFKMATLLMRALFRSIRFGNVNALVAYRQSLREFLTEPHRVSSRL